MFQGTQVEAAIKKYSDKDVRWSMQGMLRLMPDAMTHLFQPTIDNIKNAILHVINEPTVQGLLTVAHMDYVRLLFFFFFAKLCFLKYMSNRVC